VTRRELPDVLDTLDPADSGFVTYNPFLSYVALNLHHNDDESEDHSEEVQDAYNLFTNNTTGPISLPHLRRIARLLKEEVSDDALKDMLVEANGEPREGWKRGVDIEDFESVMKRAGVFS
jgi:Ca2+-binding EF-hand superfamily protein